MKNLSRVMEPQTISNNGEKSIFSNIFRKAAVVAIAATMNVAVHAHDKLTMNVGKSTTGASVRSEATNMPSIGITAGLNFTHIAITATDGGYASAYNSTPGFHIGAFIEGSDEATPNFLVQFGLAIAQNRFESEVTFLGQTIKESIRMTYLKVPLNFQWLFFNRHMFLQWGVHGGFAIGGEAVPEVNGVREDSEKLTFGNNEDEHYFRRFDWGLRVGPGLQFGNVQAAITGHVSPRNLIPGGSDDLRMFNMGWMLSVSYIFR